MDIMTEYPHGNLYVMVMVFPMNLMVKQLDIMAPLDEIGMMIMVNYLSMEDDYVE